MTGKGSASTLSLLGELDALLGAGVESPAADWPQAESAAAPQTPLAPGNGQPRLTRKPRVLVIDDKKDYREVVQYLLNERGYEVLTAENGIQGMETARRERPDLILLDFNMPGLNGYEVLQELRGDDDLRKTLIIMFTGAPHRRHLREMGLALDDFLEKPISNAKLVEAVDRAIRQRWDIPAPEELPPAPALPPPPEPELAAVPEPVPQLALPPLSVLPPLPEPVEEAPLPVPEPLLEAPAPAPERPAVKLEDMPQLEDLERADLGPEGELLVDVDKEDKKQEEAHGLDEMDENSPLVKQLNRILVRGVEMGASDIHIEPQERELVVRVRLNGSLSRMTGMPASLSARVSARVKIMAELSITERRLPQDGQFRATINGKKIEFRVSILPSAYGEKIVLRILGGTKIKKGLGELGLSDKNSQFIEKALRTPHGLILVTGPTGSGKTTTLYTMLGMLNQPDVNIVTAEDPIEYRLPGITQTHVQPGIGLTFEAILRSFLRQDPDVMLVGEIRDLETAEIAVKASITGHLVLSTLHTNSASATIARLTHMGLAPYLVAASVKLVVAQRLVKVLCPDCKTEVPIGEEERRLLNEGELSRLQRVYRSAGCRKCHQTGYAGRQPVFEVMPVQSPGMRQVILTENSGDRIAEQAVREGMVTLREAAMDLVARGETSLPEALKIILVE